jgi:hypothetical protein
MLERISRGKLIITARFYEGDHPSLNLASSDDLFLREFIALNAKATTMLN